MTGVRVPGGAAARGGLTVALALACVLAATREAPAQDLEPKAYSASPVGASFLVLGLSRSSGSVLTVSGREHGRLDPEVGRVVGLLGRPGTEAPGLMLPIGRGMPPMRSSAGVP